MGLATPNPYSRGFGVAKPSQGKCMNTEQEVWDFLDRHLQSVFNQDKETYIATTSDELSLYE